MKLITSLLPLAAMTAAFVIPDEELTNQIIIQTQKDSRPFLDRAQAGLEETWSGIEETFKDAVAFSENAIDNAINAATRAGNQAASTFECHDSMTKFDAQEWINSAVSTVEDLEDLDLFEGNPEKPREKSHKKSHKKPHKKPHHGHHHSPNKTVYELIATSKYTTKLANLINEYPDLVETLNGTAANYTVFAPTDKAFEKLPKGHKPSKELIKKVLAYHVSPDFYPAGRVLVTSTIPTALGEESLGGEPQRLRVGFSLGKGLNINFYSRIVAVNIVRTPLCNFPPHTNFHSSAPMV